MNLCKKLHSFIVAAKDLFCEFHKFWTKFHCFSYMARFYFNNTMIKHFVPSEECNSTTTPPLIAPQHFPPSDYVQPSASVGAVFHHQSELLLWPHRPAYTTLSRLPGLRSRRIFRACRASLSLKGRWSGKCNFVDSGLRSGL